MTAREMDIMQVELDKKMELFLEELVRSHLGERMNNAQITNSLVADGRNNGTETYNSTGRYPGQYSGAVRGNAQPNIGR